MDQLKLLAYEGLIRRFAYSHDYLPFMIKGSFLTRQYFPKTLARIPQDLDWVCLKPLVDKKLIQSHLNQWMHYLTTVQLDDAVRFNAFPLDSEWYELNYLMSEDFPTLNIYLSAWVNEQPVMISIDVSFNLDTQSICDDLLYQPVQGKAFHLKKTPSIATQIAWKLHQCIVNPRYKDIFDLTWLLQHSAFLDDVMKMFAVMILKDECDRDNLQLKEYLHQGSPILPQARRELKRDWDQQRPLFDFTDLKNIPENFETFWGHFTQALINAEFLDYLADA